ncbi:SDR family oxidoreductase [Pseudoalteromonas sp. Hal040]|uniref:UDP-glucose 4-epimerase family protein n=1 Tax=unclassified Pseudoalteromonas TaxID=194690 RepID=UPI00301BA626
MDNLLITGYSGFVGSYLTKKLEGHYNLNLVGRKDSSIGRVFKQNIDADSQYADALQGVSCVIHIAARVHVMNEKAAEPLEEFRAVNTLGTINLAKQAAKAGVNRFIFISTIKVNGESTTNSAAFTYEDEPLPEDPYGISKAEAEQQLLELGHQTGMEIVIIRPPLVYGEGVKANFASLMKLVGKGIPLPFKLINKNKRSLVSVYNLVDLIQVCIGHPSAANQVFLVSDDNDLSTADMIAFMAKAQNKNNFTLPIPVWCFRIAGQITGKQAMVDRLVGSLQLDITHTKSTLNWAPPYTVEHGFKLAIK